MSILSVSKLYESHGANPVVNGICFELKRGECFGLLGPNGAGKTTTLASVFRSHRTIGRPISKTSF